MQTKKCCNCHEGKPLDEFHRNRGKKDGRSSRCKSCSAIKARELREKYKASHANGVDKNGTKICAVCKTEKSKQEFYEQLDSKDGLAYCCMECAKERTRQWTRDNPEKSMRWYWENREYAMSLNRDWKRRNAEHVKEYKKKYNKDHKIEIQQWRKRYYKENREQIRRHKQLTKEQTRKTRRKWVENNRELVRAKGHRRRARELNCYGSYTPEEWDNLCRKYLWHCLSCGKHHNESPLSRDHVIPLTSGGSNDINNIQGLCLSCNQSKGTKSTDYRSPENMNPKVKRLLEI